MRSRRAAPGDAAAGPIGVRLCSNGHASWGAVLKVHLIPFIASIPLIGIGYVSYVIGPGWLGLFVWCPIAALVSATLYAVVLRSLDPVRYRDFTDLINKARQKLPGRGTTTNS